MSCSNDPIDVEKPQKETTVEIQELAQRDTALYKVVELKRTLYLLNKDNIVVKKVENLSGVADTLFLIIIILVVGGASITAIVTEQ